MSATVGQEMIYPEPAGRPLWNDEDAMQQAQSSPGPVPARVMSADENNGQPSASPDGSKGSENLTL